MKTKLITIPLACIITSLWAHRPQPVWELGKQMIAPTLSTGQIHPVQGVIEVDAQNTFAIPVELLGDQETYTIEFDVKRPASAINGHSITLCSNTDTNAQQGLALVYHPPSYNCAWMYINGEKMAILPKLLDDQFNTITLLVKDRELLIFKNGLLLAATDAIRPSERPLRFGGGYTTGKSPQAYQLRNIKLYQDAVFPKGYDRSTEIMLSTSGDQYTMFRAKIKDPSLPRILVVGDSISIAYREYISDYFRDKAYVDYWVGGRWYEPVDLQDKNAKVKRAYRGVLANGPYDVVSWNPMTLHMWNPDNPQSCSVENYPENLTEIVHFLKELAPSTQFFWVRCTPYSTVDANKQRTIDYKRSTRLDTFNQLSDTIMQNQGIPTIDLWAVCEDHPQLSSGDGVHWPKASQLFAETIAKAIEPSLPIKK
ncbi:SGNH/GDSL hydrolase family protein [Coraliomargarita algicola]|uniref:SGNH/GDSL hydrolase family protein n=1 Tax=Coraliomargarita algicola TaxID=3092156 RepID=A0ABZ0RJX1_9BACT|nr:SGNH/GDSL hydrolase family protein [Coraliomargarita sp. J2-16]WPJ95559.1 SGNH/GDSL hydrolase family protein [Coraliomargarita sp. J2-16]